MWHSVWAELSAFLGLMPLLRADWRRGWLRQVLAVDASLYGWGIATSEWEIDEVEEGGRVPERARWKRAPGEGARASALRHAGFDAESGSVRNLDLADEWETDKNFAEIPARLLKKSRWKTIKYDRWKFTDGDMYMYEGRVTLKAVERVACRGHGAAGRALILGDNMGCVLSFERARSKKFEFLTLLRRYAAHSMLLFMHFSSGGIPANSIVGMKDRESTIPNIQVTKTFEASWTKCTMMNTKQFIQENETHSHSGSCVPDRSFCEDGAEAQPWCSEQPAIAVREDEAEGTCGCSVENSAAADQEASASQG